MGLSEPSVREPDQFSREATEATERRFGIVFVLNVFTVFMAATPVCNPDRPGRSRPVSSAILVPLVGR
jgi:hypothetical protein